MVMVDEDEYERLRRAKQPATPVSVGPVLTPSLNRAKEDVSEMVKVRDMDVPDTDKADMYERLLTKYFADLRSLTPSARQTATPRTRPDDPMASVTLRTKSGSVCNGTRALQEAHRWSAEIREPPAL